MYFESLPNNKIINIERIKHVAIIKYATGIDIAPEAIGRLHF
jgi:hypothetical protein